MDQVVYITVYIYITVRLYAYITWVYDLVKEMWLNGAFRTFLVEIQGWFVLSSSWVSKGKTVASLWIPVKKHLINEKKNANTVVLYKDFRPWEKPSQHTWKNFILFYVCWYSQSAVDTSLAFGAPRSGWWINGKAFMTLNTSCLPKLSRIMAAKTLKIRIFDRNEVQTFLEEEENQYTKKINRKLHIQRLKC